MSCPRALRTALAMVAVSRSQPPRPFHLERLNVLALMAGEDLIALSRHVLTRAMVTLHPNLIDMSLRSLL